MDNNYHIFSNKVIYLWITNSRINFLDFFQTKELNNMKYLLFFLVLVIFFGYELTCHEYDVPCVANPYTIQDTILNTTLNMTLLFQSLSWKLCDSVHMNTTIGDQQQDICYRVHNHQVSRYIFQCNNHKFHHICHSRERVYNTRVNNYCMKILQSTPCINPNFFQIEFHPLQVSLFVPPCTYFPTQQNGMFNSNICYQFVYNYSTIEFSIPFPFVSTANFTVVSVSNLDRRSLKEQLKHTMSVRHVASLRHDFIESQWKHIKCHSSYGKSSICHKKESLYVGQATWFQGHLNVFNEMLPLFEFLLFFHLFHTVLYLLSKFLDQLYE